MATIAAPPSQLTPFVNEPYADFSHPENADLAQKALAKVRAEFGKEYDLFIAGERRRSTSKLQSVNPARPSEVIGVHQKGSEDDAREAIETAAAYFPTWAAVAMEDRVRMVVRTAKIIKERKFEFDAWLVAEAGKTWAEAEGEVAEAIDFCEYYARQALKLANPDPVVQLSGERGEMIYLPLGVGVVIPPWNFPLAILAGMTVATLVVGNTAVIKPSSDTPTVGGEVRRSFAGSRFSAAKLFASDGKRGGDRRRSCLLIRRPALLRSPAREMSACTSTNSPRKHPKASSGLSAWWRKWAGKTPSSWIAKRMSIRLFKAFSPQRSATRDRSVRLVREQLWMSPSTTNSLQKLKSKAEALTVGPPEELTNYMGPVINGRAKESILKYIETGKSEGRLLVGGEPGPKAKAISLSRRSLLTSTRKRESSRKRFLDRCSRSRNRRISTTVSIWRTTPNMD